MLARWRRVRLRTPSRLALLLTTHPPPILLRTVLSSVRRLSNMWSLKQWALDTIGYDENVVQAASSTRAVKGLTRDLPKKVRGLGGAFGRNCFAGSAGAVADSKLQTRHCPQGAAYVKQLFPFTKWIGNYNLNWFVGDLIAGLTASRFTKLPPPLRADPPRFATGRDRCCAARVRRQPPSCTAQDRADHDFNPLQHVIRQDCDAARRVW